MEIKAAKKLIVVVYPYGFRTFDWDRFEIDELSVGADIEIHELIDFLHPSFSVAYMERMHADNIFSFSSFFQWKKRFNESILRRGRSNCIVFDFVPATSGLRNLAISLVLCWSGCKIVRFANPGVPVPTSKSRLSKIVNVIFSKQILIGNWPALLEKMIARLASVHLKCSPDYLLVGGLNAVSTHQDTRRESIRLNASSWDYSRILRMRNVSTPRPISVKYAVLLDGAGPKFFSDALLMKQRVSLTAEKWYPALCTFFDSVEKFFNIRMVIAAHTMTVHDRNPDYFGGREVFHGATYALVKYSEFVITRQSTAISFALHFEKPIVFITSDELELVDEFKKSARLFHEELSLSAINIDHFDNSMLNNVQSEGYSKGYSNFIDRYLSTANPPQPNCEILLNKVICPSR